MSNVIQIYNSIITLVQILKLYREELGVIALSLEIKSFTFCLRAKNNLRGENSDHFISILTLKLSLYFYMKYIIIRYNFCFKKISKTVEDIHDDECSWEKPSRQLPGVCTLPRCCDMAACLLSYKPREPSEGPTLTAPNGRASHQSDSADRKSKREHISEMIDYAKAVSFFSLMCVVMSMAGDTGY